MTSAHSVFAQVTDAFCKYTSFKFHVLPEFHCELYLAVLGDFHKVRSLNPLHDYLKIQQFAQILGL